MSTNLKVIKFLIIVTGFFAVATYIVSVYCDVDKVWINNAFLELVFGGLFTSGMIVLMLEIQKYMINKHCSKVLLFNNARSLYIEISLYQGILKSYILHKDVYVPKELFVNRLPQINCFVNNIHLIDYTPCNEKDFLLAKLNDFRRDKCSNLNEYVNNFTYLQTVIIQEEIKIIKYNRDYQTNEIFTPKSENERIRSVMKKLVALSNVQLESLNNFLSDLDLSNNGKFQWNSVKEILDRQTYDIADQDKISEEFINN
ncbi:MAG: hypothetical protein R3Y45_04620 [Bacillota bacterium]